MTKEEAIEIIERYKISDPGSLYDIHTNLACDMAIKALKEIERLKVEQPKVIRCKDCKFAYRKETYLSNSYECRYPFSIIKENHYGDFFCAFAEPKDGEQDG